MTANAIVGDRERALEAGMDDYVTKPLDLDRLFAVLSKRVTPARGRGALVASPSPSPPPPADLAPLLRRLRGPLAASDTAALQMLPPVSETAPHPIHGPALKRLVTAVRNYDFAAGLTEVDALLSTLERPAQPK